MYVKNLSHHLESFLYTLKLRKDIAGSGDSIYQIDKFTFKNNIKPVFPFVWCPAMEFSEGVLKHLCSPHMDSQLLASMSFVHSLQFSSEVAPLDVKVQDSGVVDEASKRPFQQRGCALS